jgi:mannosyltransferase OCH1-like enzyme
LEFDAGWPGKFIRQFTTWTIMAKPGSPHLWMVVQDIVQSFRDTMREQNVTAEGLTLQMLGDVVDTTGPRRFTRSILRSLGETFNRTLQDTEELLEPKLAGDVLVLPGYAFAASANTYDEGMEVPPPLVTHHYAGTWKNEKGGEMS